MEVVVLVLVLVVVVVVVVVVIIIDVVSGSKTCVDTSNHDAIIINTSTTYWVLFYFLFFIFFSMQQSLHLNDHWMALFFQADVCLELHQHENQKVFCNRVIPCHILHLLMLLLPCWHKMQRKCTVFLSVTNAVDGGYDSESLIIKITPWR